MTPLRQWLQSRLAHWDGPNRPEDFERCRQTLTLRHMQIGLLVWLFGTLAWWPLDAIVYADDPLARAALAFTRPTLGAIDIAVWFALLRLVPRPRFTNATLTFATVVNTGILGATMSPLGGLDRQWFHFCYFLPFVSLMVVAPLGKRMLVTLVTGLAYPFAYLARTPSYLHDPETIPELSFLLFTLLGAVALGHGIYLFTRRDYFNQAKLEERVEERTRTLQDLATYLEHSREAERRRVARELHDHHGQLLTGMRLEIGTARVQAAKEPEVLATLDRLDDLLQQVFATQRSVIAELWPRVLEEQGATAAVRACIGDFSARAGLPVEASGLELLDTLDDVSALTTYRAAQEALTNIARYAEAKRVRISATRGNDTITLTITDDGRGFDTKTVGRGSFGLLGMRERLAALGGHLSIDSAPNRGTSLIVSLPINAAGDA